MATTIKKYESSVSINATGELTGESFIGKFTFRTRLSHKDRLQIDTIRRQLLGAQPEGAQPSPRAESSAQIFANLQVRVVDAPSWWVNSNGGMDLSDDDVVSSVFDSAIKVEQDEIDLIKKAGEEALESLKKVETP
jgi:hypothetical protein